VKKTTDQYVAALSKISDGKADVIGYAFAVNGKLSSADLYASGDLFQAQWKKLLQASAVEAVAARNSAGKFEPVKADAVKASLLTAEKAQGVAKDLTRRTRLVTRESPSAVIYETHDRSQNGWLHLSLISK
jgi:alpha-L-fucosidase